MRPKALAQGHRHQGGGGGVVVEGREHVLQGDRGIAPHLDCALHAIGDLFAVLVDALQRVEHRRHHRYRRELGVVQHLVVELLGLGAAADGQRDRNHLRGLAQAAEDAGMAVLHERAYRLGGVDDLEGVQRRSQRGHHLGFGHGQVHQAKLQQWMPAGQYTLGIDIGHGAGRGHVHVAFDQNRAHR